MCATCCCGNDGAVITVAGDHHPDHDHDPAVPTRTVSLEQKVLPKNDLLAEQNRQWLADRGILAFNVTSSPGAGKTTLLERTMRQLGTSRPVAVIEAPYAAHINRRMMWR